MAQYYVTLHMKQFSYGVLVFGGRLV